jgi:hypothetical protein
MAVKQLEFIEGTGITLTGDATNKTVTIAADLASDLSGDDSDKAPTVEAVNDALDLIEGFTTVKVGAVTF